MAGIVFGNRSDISLGSVLQEKLAASMARALVLLVLVTETFFIPSTPQLAAGFFTL
jgi:hypothetical protein